MYPVCRSPTASPQTLGQCFGCIVFNVFCRERFPIKPLQVLLASLCLLVASIPRAAFCQDPPFFAETPVITEYGVDPEWPQRPEHLSMKGWVSGLALDEDENVWVFRNTTAKPVRAYRPDGTLLRSRGSDQFVRPHHLRIDHEGNIWVADIRLHIIQKYTPTGTHLLTLRTKGELGNDERHFNQPTDVAIAASGDIFVTDGYGNRRVVHFDKDGKFLRAWGIYGSQPGQFVLPHTVAVD